MVSKWKLIIKYKFRSSELAKPFKRPYYYKARKLLNQRQILLITGLRRVGKTTLMYQLIQGLLKRVKPERILYYNFDIRASSLIDILETYSDLVDVNWENERVYVFLDEIVKQRGWVDELKLLYDSHPNLKFFVSSSSSLIIEGHALRNLAGRYFLLNMRPLDFKEYLELTGNSDYLKRRKLYKKELEKEFSTYLLKNFPETIKMSEDSAIEYYRTLITQKIVKEDMPSEFPHANLDLLETLINIVYSDPGVYVSYDSLSKSLGVSKKTLINHMRYLIRAYLFRTIKNFRPSLMSSSRKMQRVYPYWWSLAYPFDPSHDKLMESFVASYLDASYYWRKGGYEVDFVILKDKKMIPVEVKNKRVIVPSDYRCLEYFVEKYKCPKRRASLVGRKKFSG